MLQLTDTHAHLNDPAFQHDLNEVLDRARTAGVRTIICVGSDLKTSAEAVELAAQREGIYAAVGVHPHEAKSADEQTWKAIRLLAGRPKVVALGEIGLDFYYYNSPPEVQIAVFRQQILLARELGLPIIIHDRDAHEEVYRILCEEKAGDVGGVFHCFSGGLDFAGKCLDLGFYISLAGPVTFKKAGELLRVACEIPLERLLVETDAPYLAPVPYRGKRNESAFIVETAKKVAETRGMEPEELAAATSNNARKLFSLER